ncbi:hypothetical protein DFH09DRAFT_1278068 [Mycena vulgaris]|nr:hypothetical protein DFH09DRAFT_1278068 [Mycena vulgaris]
MHPVHKIEASGTLKYRAHPQDELLLMQSPLRHHTPGNRLWMQAYPPLSLHLSRGACISTTQVVQSADVGGANMTPRGSSPHILQVNRLNGIKKCEAIPTPTAHPVPTKNCAPIPSRPITAKKGGGQARIRSLSSGRIYEFIWILHESATFLRGHAHVRDLEGCEQADSGSAGYTSPGPLPKTRRAIGQHAGEMSAQYGEIPEYAAKTPGFFAKRTSNDGAMVQVRGSVGPCGEICISREA